VRSTRAWLDRAGITEGPVFRSVDRHGNLGASLGDRDVARIIKRTALAAGIDKEVVKTLAGHSLRAGLVSSAVKADKSIATIMRQTGHGSIEMVMRYVRENDLFTDNAARGLL
jgi:integrase